MHNKIIDIINYFLCICNSEDKSGSTYLEVNLTENDKSRGTIKVTFVAPWTKDFNISSSFLKLLEGNKIGMRIHHGNCIEGNYYLYKITYKFNSKTPDVDLDIEEEAFEKECDYYVSFVVETDIRNLYNAAPKLKTFIENIEKDQEIVVTYKESPGLTEENAMTKKCTNAISESIGTILQYSFSENRNKIFELLNVRMTDDAVKTLKKLTEETLQENSFN